MYAAAADFPYTCNELLIRGADLTLTNDYDQDAYTLTTTNNCKLGMFISINIFTFYFLSSSLLFIKVVDQISCKFLCTTLCSILEIKDNFFTLFIS